MEYETIFKSSKELDGQPGNYLSLVVLYVKNERGQIIATRFLSSVSRKNGSGNFERLASRTIEVPGQLARDGFRIPTFQPQQRVTSGFGRE